VTHNHGTRRSCDIPTMRRVATAVTIVGVTVTALRPGRTVDDLRLAAARAASRAEVTVREIDTPADCDLAAALLAEVWSTAPDHSPMEPNLMRALAFSGGYVAGAYSGTGLLVGVCAAFFGHESTHGMHSHIAAIAPHAQGRGLGYALKLHQRAWAAERGVATISWTFDPLVRRNAHFNLGRLGAAVSAYLPDFYGEMRDGVNAGQGSDRLLVRWDVAGAGEQIGAAADVRAVCALEVGSGEQPVARDVGASVSALTVAVPRDIEAMRRRDPQLARTWRHAVRGAVHARLEGGWRIAGFRPDAGYLLEAAS